MNADPASVRRHYATGTGLAARASLCGARRVAFAAENGEASLRRHFDRVAARPASGTVAIRECDAVLRYFHSAETLVPLVERVPDEVPLPLVARRSHVAFVADRA